MPAPSADVQRPAPAKPIHRPAPEISPEDAKFMQETTAADRLAEKMRPIRDSVDDVYDFIRTNHRPDAYLSLDALPADLKEFVGYPFSHMKDRAAFVSEFPDWCIDDEETEAFFTENNSPLVNRDLLSDDEKTWLYDSASYCHLMKVLHSFETDLADAAQREMPDFDEEYFAHPRKKMIYEEWEYAQGFLDEVEERYKAMWQEAFNAHRENRATIN